jgi:hypothetical protein
MDDERSLLAAELAAESRRLKQLIQEAQRLDAEITESLQRVRQIRPPSPQSTPT